MNPKVGDALEPFRFGPIDPQAMVVWSEILGDPNPIHLDGEAVKAMGLGTQRINQGPANLAYLINGVLQSFPQGKIERITSRFVDFTYSCFAIVKHLPIFFFNIV